MRKTKIGLFGIGLDAYWPQFAGLKERLEGYLAIVEGKLHRDGVEIVNLGLIDTPEKALDAGHAFRAVGMAKERDLTAAGSRGVEGEFSFFKGVLVALFAGVMSACMSFAFRAGAPIADLATRHGVADLWKNTPVIVVILAGGFTTNALWCVFLNVKNRSAGDYLGKTEGTAARNYLLAALAGVTWYFQFMFYGMGTTKMGAYDFSSWTLHMAFIIVFRNLWAIRLGEWRETRPRTLRLILAGIAIVFLSTLVVGISNYLGATSAGK